jgi:hypothetical protein
MALKSGSTSARRFRVLILLALTAFLIALNAFAGEPEEAEGKRENPVEREQWFLHGRTYQGKVAPQMLERAQQQRDTLRHQALQRAQVRTAATAGAGVSTPVWTELGPAPMRSVATAGDNQDYGVVTGRATTVAVDQNDPTGNTVYVGGAYGGVWKSTTAANTDITKVFWKPIIDDQPTTAVGAIAVKPGNSNVVLVGTGEANSSTDSYYGLGVLRSTDGGNSWTLITSANGGLRPFHGLAFSKFAFDSDNPNIVVATTAAASEGITVGAENPFNNPAACANATVTATCRGLYYSFDSGATWTQATISDGTAAPDNGSASSVIYNAQQHKFYASARAHGFYVSNDGITFTRMGSDPFGTSQPNPASLSLGNCPTSPTNLTTCPLYRGEMAIVPGRDEMYFWYVDSATTPVNGGIYETKDGGRTWTSLNVTGINSCGDSVGCGTQQGDYNLAIAAIPNGATATDLYAGAINIFRCQLSSANPSCGATPFINLTHVYGCSPTGAFSKVHPDQHWFDFLQSNPNIMFFANDGGIYRTIAALNANGVPASCPATPPSSPVFPFENLNSTMGSMTQLVWFSQHPSNQFTILGGTQDNGSPAVDATNSGLNGLAWRSVQGGDGGYNDINPNNGNEWFASFTRVQITRCANGTGCTDNQFQTIVNSGKLGGDSAAFYMPYMLDPDDSAKLIVGTCRVWRISTAGTSAIALSQKFDGTGGTAACAKDSTSMVNAIAGGGPNGGSGSQVIYAGTVDGRIFSTTSALTSTTPWTEVSASGGFSNPNGYPISGIAIDSRDATGRTAYVTVMGFRTSHVWRTTDAGATWTDISGTSSPIPDSPASAVVVDKNTGTVYVGTDVGVFSTDTPSGSSTVWTEVGPATGVGALPNVAVTRLAIFAPSGQPARLRVSTYGRGIWEMPLASTGVADYSLAISNPSLLTYPGQAVTFNGNLSAIANYNSAVTLSCDASTGGVAGPLPTTCNPTPAAPNPATTTSFTVSAANASVGDFSFRIKGVGADANSLVRLAPVNLRVIDFSLSALTPSSITNLEHGDSASVQFTVTSLGSFDQQVTFGCTGLPALWSCTANPVTLAPAGSAQVVLTINSHPSTPAPQTIAGINVVATWTGSGGVVRTQSQPISVSVVKTAFTLGGPKFTSGVVKVGQPLTSTISLLSPDTPGKTLTLSCTGPTSFGIAPSACSFNPPTVTAGTTAVTSSLTVNTSPGSAGNGQVTVQATDGTVTKVAVLPFTLTDFIVSNVSQPNDTGTGGTVTFNFLLTPSAGYNAAVVLGCDTSAFSVPVSCVFNPTAPTLVAGTTTRVNASMALPGNVPLGTYAVILKTNDAVFTSLVHNQALGKFQVTLQPDYTMSFGTTNSATVKAGATTTGTLAVSAVGTFNSSVTLSIGGCPSNATCTVSPNPANPTASTPVSATLTILTKAPTTGSLRGLGQGNYLALWIGVSFGAIGFVFLRRTRGSVAMLVIVCALLLGMSACGGGGGGGGGTTPIPVPGTPAGTYTLTVTGTAGTTVKTANFTLTVQ